MKTGLDISVGTGSGPAAGGEQLSLRHPLPSTEGNPLTSLEELSNSQASSGLSRASRMERWGYRSVTSAAGRATALSVAIPPVP